MSDAPCRHLPCAFGRKATSGANKGSNGGELRVLFRGTPLTAAEVQAVSTRLN